MKIIKISKHCEKKLHGFCDPEWQDQDGQRYICDCGDGQCHQNYGAIALHRPAATALAGEQGTDGK